MWRRAHTPLNVKETTPPGDVENSTHTLAAVEDSTCTLLTVVESTHTRMNVVVSSRTLIWVSGY